MATEQTLTASYCQDVENVLRQLRETLSTAQLKENTWSQIYALGVDGQIDNFLTYLMQLTTELHNVEKSRAMGGDYVG